MTQKNILISDFDYDLPDERIAKHPLEQRDACRLLRRGADGQISEHVFSQLPTMLPDDAMLVYNNTRVINARLHFRKASGAAIEIFCLEPNAPADYAECFASTSGCRWLCFVGNSKRWREGRLELSVEIGGEPVTVYAERVERVGNASVVEFTWEYTESDTTRPERPSPQSAVSFAEIIEAAGEIPIPPYLNRDTEASDSTDYQTVYSHISGSVAAPTAGLHFTDAVLEGISARGIPRRELTLHVGAGTFQPVKDDDVSQHVMHSEFISVPIELIDELATTSRRVYAVGTTSVRTLESLYHIGCLIYQGRFDEYNGSADGRGEDAPRSQSWADEHPDGRGEDAPRSQPWTDEHPDGRGEDAPRSQPWAGTVPQWYPYEEGHPQLTTPEALRQVAAWLRERGLTRLVASTRIIIAPGYTYRIVRGMITNFHQPRSTLLLLVSAFIGDDWRGVYDYALEHGFRFLSYGDACLFEG